MRALLARGTRDWSVEDVPEPDCAPGGLVVDVEAAGVCAADRMLWSGEHPWGALDWPLRPGHELLGRVRESQRDDVPVGTRVTVEVKVPCGRCRWCASGRYHLCPEGAHLGSGFPGAFADRVALPAGALVHAVPESLPTAVAVLAENSACAVHAVRRGDVRPGDAVLVVGLGSIGSLAAVAGRRAGGDVTVTTRHIDDKQDVIDALRLGVLRPEDVAPAAYDVVIECSGSAGGIATALDAAAPGGRLVLYGVTSRPVSVDVNQIAEFKELDVRGGHLAPHAFPAGIEMLAAPGIGTLASDVVPLASFASVVARHSRLKGVLVP
ncbi:MAG: zinc-dependent alcohol dehydrogenase [Actinomycetales bacterium]